MNQKYRSLLSQLLPISNSKKYTVFYPILYIYNSNKNLLYSAYSYDKNNKLIYVSDYNQVEYRYISLYEFENDGWIILTNNESKSIIYSLEPFESPF